ncbi:recombinase family protein [Acetobacter tropicalis]|nr:recombinase family protein [Acetobacter tropicalis]
MTSLPLASSPLQPLPSLRAALYLRVSTGRQAEHDLSIPDQQRQTEAYCAAKGWVVAEVFIEPGASATDDRRPEFQKLMEAALEKPRRFDVVVVHSFSRFFRDHFKLEFNVRRLAKQEIRLVSITQEFGNDPYAVMVRQIMAVFDEYQSRENAKHTLRAMNENARQGFWNGSRPPFGYRTAEAERRGQKVKKKLEIDPIQAETVRLIFGLYRDGDGQSGGLGIKAIVSHLNAKGYRTQTGSRFSCKFIHDVLTRETYAGKHAFNVVEAKTGRKKASDEVITMDAPVIIPRSEFLEVQQRLKQNAPRVTAPRIVNGPCLLTGLAVCATCGGGMTLRTGKYGRYRYYTCATQARQGKTACKGRSIRMDLLDTLVMEHLATRLLTKDRLGVILEALLAHYAANQNRDAARQESLRNASREAGQKLQRIYAAIENGIVDPADPMLRERLDALKAQRDEASRLCAMAEAPAMVVPVITDEMIERFSHDLRAKLTDGPVAMRKEYLRAIVDRIEVDDSEIRIFGRKDRLMNQLVSDRPKLNPKVPSFGREWRPVRDSNPCCRRERAISGG